MVVALSTALPRLPFVLDVGEHEAITLPASNFTAWVNCPNGS
jgi:hypothetical protein